ncbi:hypothetical protein BOTBODRAFT_221899 [Botryobasidium botryosum FD-172 SS1]|uniref:F-box domain-containing protein n=1 Tax=Botryobasidium botryosum (strain FD-172 SS1) TaxID=930990 RepID=A0A067MYL4_BOTB1|nr:hypothetical protein BOTBODRAFT_221899 [Botryobasidium botryosum FD-172 SS1]
MPHPDLDAPGLSQAAASTSESYTAPIDIIPAEILHKIFEALDSSADWTTPSVLRASHVCRLWRQLIHASSAFWSQLDLFTSNAEVDLHAAYWLDRAGSQPLSITIRSYRSKEGLETVSEDIVRVRLDRLRGVLQPTMARWVSFSAIIQPDLIESFFSGFRGMTPSLKSMSICAAFWNEDAGGDEDEDDWNEYDYLALPIHVPFFGDPHHAPGAIQGISVRATDCVPTFATFGLSITDLELNIEQGAPIHSYTVLDMLRTCPNLKELVLAGIDLIPSIVQSENPRLVELSQLTYLLVDGLKGIENVLIFIHAPSVQRVYHRYLEWNDRLSVALFQISGSSNFIVDFRIWPNANIKSNNWDYVPRFRGWPITLGAVEHFVVATPPFLRLLSIPNAHILSLANVPFDVVRLLALSTTHLENATLAAISQCPATLHPIFIRKTGKCRFTHIFKYF